jgi:hypothetical protein
VTHRGGPLKAIRHIDAELMETRRAAIEKRVREWAVVSAVGRSSSVDIYIERDGKAVKVSAKSILSAAEKRAKLQRDIDSYRERIKEDEYDSSNFWVREIKKLEAKMEEVTDGHNTGARIVLPFGRDVELLVEAASQSPTGWGNEPMKYISRLIGKVETGAGRRSKVREHATYTKIERLVKERRKARAAA